MRRLTLTRRFINLRELAGFRVSHLKFIWPVGLQPQPPATAGLFSNLNTPGSVLKSPAVKARFCSNFGLVSWRHVLALSEVATVPCWRLALPLTMVTRAAGAWPYRAIDATSLSKTPRQKNDMADAEAIREAATPS